jgi:hypothetical protein
MLGRSLWELSLFKKSDTLRALRIKIRTQFEFEESFISNR